MRRFMGKLEQEFKSPAKINLRLEILHKRKDGYHELRMLNTLTDLADTITIRLVEKGIKVSVYDDPQVPSGEANIAFRACKEVLAYSNKNIGVEMDIRKRIPSAAGLGGGSSNAATVLTALNHMLKIGLAKDKIMKIGLKLGSDVPFFLFGAPVALATGIGEKLQKVKALPKCNLLIVTPKISVSSEWAYSEYRGVPREELEEVPLLYRTKRAVQKVMLNDLEKVTERRYPVITKIKEVLLNEGAIAAQMSGSGPSTFGIFSQKSDAEAAFHRVSKTNPNWRCYLAESL